MAITIYKERSIVLKLNENSGVSIYVQIAESIKEQILRGIYIEDEQVPSTNELAKSLNINPATAGKGLNLLVDEGILYKKRGVGMFVSPGSKENILITRKNKFCNKYIYEFISEAQNLGISKEELINMINSAKFN